jgi:hypothetical protein
LALPGSHPWASSQKEFAKSTDLLNSGRAVYFRVKKQLWAYSHFVLWAVAMGVAAISYTDTIYTRCGVRATRGHLCIATALLPTMIQNPAPTFSRKAIYRAGTTLVTSGMCSFKTRSTLFAKVN